MSINRESRIFCLVRTLFGKLYPRCYPQATYWLALWAKATARWWQPHSENEHQWSVNCFGCCIMYNPRAILRLLPIIEVLADFIGNMVDVVCATTKMSINRASTERQQSVNRASTERQQSVNRASTERQQSVNRASTERQQSVNRVSTERQQSVNAASTERQQSVNRASTEHQQSIDWASTILGVKSCIIQGLCYGIWA